MNIDNDIEILKKLANTKFDKQLLNSIAMITEQDEVYILNIQERQAIENVLKELEIKDKMIDLMAVDLALKYSYQYNDDLDEKEKVKEHFRKKVENEK